MARRATVGYEKSRGTNQSSCHVRIGGIGADPWVRLAEGLRAVWRYASTNQSSCHVRIGGVGADPWVRLYGKIGV
jgi:hypothetical protein